MTEHEALLERLGLTELMARTSGRADLAIGLIDGPVRVDHPDLACPIEQLGAAPLGPSTGAAQAHGTFVAGILGARRGCAAPALCPACPLMVRPVFLEVDGATPGASFADLAAAIRDVVEAGARVVNLSLAVERGRRDGEQALAEALDAACRQGVLVVAAAGNEGRVRSTALTRHPWVLPVVASDAEGARPSGFANLNGSAARRGLMAPGERLRSLASDGGTRVASGSSYAAPLVTGAAALLGSLFPDAPAHAIRDALVRAAGPRRSVVPPLLDAARAHRQLARDLR